MTTKRKHTHKKHHHKTPPRDSKGRFKKRK